MYGGTYARRDTNKPICSVYAIQYACMGRAWALTQALCVCLCCSSAADAAAMMVCSLMAATAVLVQNGARTFINNAKCMMCTRAVAYKPVTHQHQHTTLHSRAPEMDRADNPESHTHTQTDTPTHTNTTK